MSESDASGSGDLMLQLQKLQSEIAENSSSSSAKLVSKSTFEEFRNEQNKINSEMIETLRMMREEMTRGTAGISADIEEKQKNIKKEMLENLETIEDEVTEMKEKQEEIQENIIAELKTLSQDVAQLKKKEYSRTKMQIFIETVTGKTIPIQITPADSVYSLKVEIQGQEGFSPNIQRLIFQGQHLQDNCTLQHYNIVEQSRLYLVFPLRG